MTGADRAALAQSIPAAAMLATVAC